MREALVVGGASGIGLAIALQLAERADYGIVHIVDRAQLPEDICHEKFRCHQFDLTSEDYAFFDRFGNIDTLMITAGFGHLALFKDLTEDYIVNIMNVNATAVMRLVSRFYDRIASSGDFYCGVMVSIAGFMSSPFFSVYGASKAALKIFIESVNVELEKAGFSNRILNVSPGSIKGTGFSQGKTDLAFSTANVQTDQIMATPFLADPMTVLHSADLKLPDLVDLEMLLLSNEVYIKWSAEYAYWHRSVFGADFVPQIELELMGQIELFVSKPGKWAFVPKSVADNLCCTSDLRQSTPAFPIPARTLYMLRHRDNAETANICCFLDILREVLLERNAEGLLL